MFCQLWVNYVYLILLQNNKYGPRAYGKVLQDVFFFNNKWYIVSASYFNSDLL